MEKVTPTLFERALKIAVTAHAAQVRKSDGSPYVVHPIMVSRMVEKAGGSEAAVIAALVHDVLEDTKVTEAELRALLGDAVVDIVAGVCEDQSLEWEARKEKYIERVATSSDETKLVSVADKIHNAHSLLEHHAVHGKAAWEKFNRGEEKKVWFERTFCNRLKASWQHPLLEEYDLLVEKIEQLD